MAETEEMKFHLKATVIKERKKVLFVEVDDKLVDILLSFLTLPLGTIVRLLIKYHEPAEAPIIGGLNSLYRGLENMSIGFFRAEEVKMMLLQQRNPVRLDCAKLKIDLDDTPPVQFYACKKGKLMNKKVSPVEDLNKQPELNHRPLSKGDSVFKSSLSSFILGDDLQILPNKAESCSQILRQYKVESKEMLETMSCSWGFQQIMTLLERSLLSQTPLSDMIFRTVSETRKDVSPAVKFNSKQYRLLGKTRDVTVRVLTQKSTNRILFIESPKDFIEILFGFLALPLGTAHRLCDGDCGLGSIGNLYHSTFRKDLKIHVKRGPVYRFIRSWCPYLSSRRYLNFKDPKEVGDFLQSSPPFWLTVMEDLEVATVSIGLILSTLRRLDIEFNEIQQQELKIGVEEVSCLLKAALSSKCALTDGLKQFLK